MTAVVGVLVALGVLVGAGPRPRRVVPARSTGGVSGDRPPVRQAAFGTWRDGRRGPGGRRGARPGADDLGTVVTTVSTLLRAGARPADAWARALGLPACGAVPAVDQLLGGSVPAVRGRRQRRPTPGQRGRAQAVVAAAVVAQQLGAPLATVLEEVAAAVVADEEAEAELAAALSGPRASVRVLLGLPVLGLLLGAAVGGDPVAVLLDGGLGTASGVAGCALAAAGWVWSRALVARAREAATP